MHLYLQEAEFDVYAKYACDVLRPEGAETLAEVVSRPDVSDALTSAGHGFKEAVKYYLPKLLLVPVYHVFTYFKDIEVSFQAKTQEFRLSCIRKLVFTAA